MIALLKYERSTEYVEASWARFLERQKHHADRVSQQRQQRQHGDETAHQARAAHEADASWGGFLERQEQHGSAATQAPPKILSARRTHRTWEYQIRTPFGAAATAWVEGRDLPLSPRVDPTTRKQMEQHRATVRLHG